MTSKSGGGEDHNGSEIGLDLDFGVVADGAAADASEDREHKENIPRLLRYALLVNSFAEHINERLIAEIEQLCPNMLETAAWGRESLPSTGLALAAALDLRAVERDRPALRSLSDCVRMLALPAEVGLEFFEEHDRVASALLQGFRKLPFQLDPEVRCDLEQFVYGWAALFGCREMLTQNHRIGTRNAAVLASWLGKKMVEHRINHAWISAQKLAQDAKDGDRSADAKEAVPEEAQVPEGTPPERTLVVSLSESKLRQVKPASFTETIKHIFNKDLPLRAVPELKSVRDRLVFEFPYAVEVIDFALADLVSRSTVRLRPLLLVGDPGGGKSRFARRLGEVLGLHVWRTDASQSDGAVFAGTDRRWHTSDACHPLLAIARGNSANPLILLDELEKAGTRTDYGRLWDCLLGFLEPESSARYQDPALQVPVNLSHVSYVATANTLDSLPVPLRDRFRIIRFPKPEARHLDALLPAVVADLAAEQGLDPRWVVSLDGEEHGLIGKHWQGGSVRRLRRVIEVILRERETVCVRH